MKTAVTQTSVRSYHAMRDVGFKGQHQQILDIMVQGRIYSRRQIAAMLKMETSTCSARCNKLLEWELIEVCGHIHCPITGVKVEAVKLVGAQLELLN